MRLIKFSGILVVYPHNTYTTIHRNIINNNNERTHFFRKIYLSHFIRKGCERVVCERWVGDGTDCNILTPSSSNYSSTSFSFCWAAQLGVTEGLKSSVWSWFSLPWTATQTPINWLQLTQAICGTSLYNCLMPTCFLWVSQLHWIQPVHRSRWYPNIFNRMHLLFTQVHLLIDSSVEGQYVTFWVTNRSPNSNQKTRLGYNWPKENLPYRGGYYLSRPQSKN